MTLYLFAYFQSKLGLLSNSFWAYTKNKELEKKPRWQKKEKSDTSSRKSLSSLSTILIEVKTVRIMREKGKTNVKMWLLVVGPTRVTKLRPLSLLLRRLPALGNQTAREMGNLRGFGDREAVAGRRRRGLWVDRERERAREVGWR